MSILVKTTKPHSKDFLCAKCYKWQFINISHNIIFKLYILDKNKTWLIIFLYFQDTQAQMDFSLDRNTKNSTRIQPKASSLLSLLIQSLTVELADKSVLIVSQPAPIATLDTTK